jgi:hypothetical protein
MTQIYLWLSSHFRRRVGRVRASGRIFQDDGEQ